MNKITGINKRFHQAYMAIKSSDTENVLYNLYSVIDSTAKKYYPNENSVGKRFKKYIDDNLDDILLISTNGIKVIGLTSFYNGIETVKISQILYNLRNGSYHDPEEVENIAELADQPKGIGIKLIDINFAIGIFLILFSDNKNGLRINNNLFSKIEVINTPKRKIPLMNLKGCRKKLIKLYI